MRPFADEASLPLRGITVLDLSRFLAGPYAATILGDLGANVIKIEALDRDDPAAHTAPMLGKDSLYYLSTVRNKRSIALNLKDQRGYEILTRLAARADVAIENYRADVPAKLKLDFEHFQKMNPRLVLCSVRSFSKESTVADDTAYDSVVQAYAGLMSVTGQPDGPPARMGIAVADLGSGLFSAIGMLAAIIKARETGVGSHVEVALADTGIGLLAMQLSGYMNTGNEIRRSGTEHPSMAPQRVFSTATKDILLMAAKNEEYVRLCNAIGKPELIDDPRYTTNGERVTLRTELHAKIAPVIATKSAEEWSEIFKQARVACTIVRDISDVAADDDFRRTMLSRHEHPRIGDLQLVRNPLLFDDASLPFRSLAPDWGEHTEDVLTELGLDAQTLIDLRADGVVR